MDYLVKKLLNGAKNGNANEMIFAIEQGADIHSYSLTDEDGLKIGYTPAMYAIKTGNAKGLAALIQHGVKLDFIPKESKVVEYNPVLETIKGKHTACLKLLVQQGFDVNQPIWIGDNIQTTALMEATANRDLPSMYFLIEKGADVNTKTYFYRQNEDTKMMTPLMQATLNGDAEAARLLLMSGANEQAVNENRETALLLASQTSPVPIDVVTLLIEHGADINHKDKFGNRPLMYAAMFSDSEPTGRKLIKILLDQMVQINGVNNNGTNAIAFACSTPNVSMENIMLLVEHDARIHNVDDYGMTPLIYAIHYNPNRVDLISYLLHNGANMFVRFGRDALNSIEYAEKQGLQSLVKLFKDFQEEFKLYPTHEEIRYSGYPQISAKQSSLNNALLDAIQMGNLDSMELLLDKGAEIQAECVKPVRGIDTGYTPLMAAVSLGDIDAIRLCLGRGADVDYVSSKGDSALFIAIEDEKHDCLECLIDAGADVSSYSKKLNETALVCASRMGDLATVKLLVESGADLEDKRNAYGQSALNKACCPPVEARHEAVIAFLLKSGASVNTQDSWGYTPLMNARGDLNVCEMLLSRYPDLDIVNENGRTVIDLANFEKRGDLLAVLSHYQS